MTRDRQERVLAVYPHTKGLAFFVTEGMQIIDYGNISHPNQDYVIDRLSTILDSYGVARLITEKFTKESKRGSKTQELVKAFRAQAKKKKLSVSSYSKAQVRLVFEPQKALTKHQRAKAVCDVFTPLQAILPPPRKIWEGEHIRMFIFDCAVLTIVHNYLRRS